MGKIKKYNKFVDENVGYGIVGQVGIGYGETGVQNKTVNSHDTNEIFCEFDDKFYNIDDYNNIYQEYLKTPEGGKNPLEGFSHDNIISILQVLRPELFKK